MDLFERGKKYVGMEDMSSFNILHFKKALQKASPDVNYHEIEEKLLMCIKLG